MKYLVVECQELGDAYECDANRIPRFITDDWKNHNYDYCFEVYEILENGEIGEKIKNYDDYFEEGMALYYWTKDEDCEEVEPHIVCKYPNYTRNDTIPSVVKESIKRGIDVDDSLKTCGNITYYIGDDYYVYGEYNDSGYSLGY